jgi:hypothetical protein
MATNSDDAYHKIRSATATKPRGCPGYSRRQAKEGHQQRRQARRGDDTRAGSRSTKARPRMGRGAPKVGTLIENATFALNDGE